MSLIKNLYLHFKLWPSGFSSGRLWIKRQCRCEWFRVKRRAVRLLPRHTPQVRENFPTVIFLAKGRYDKEDNLKQTGIRYEKNIFSVKARKTVRLKVQVFIELLSGSARNYIPLRSYHLISHSPILDSKQKMFDRKENPEIMVFRVLNF